jgi:hypothetical protein
MKRTLKPLSYLGLALSLFPSMFFAAGYISMETSKNIMIIGMFLWFGTAVFWIKKSSFEDDDSAGEHS